MLPKNSTACHLCPTFDYSMVCRYYMYLNYRFASSHQMKCITAVSFQLSWNKMGFEIYIGHHVYNVILSVSRISNFWNEIKFYARDTLVACMSRDVPSHIDVVNSNTHSVYVSQWTVSQWETAYLIVFNHVSSCFRHRFAVSCTIV